MKNRGQSGIEYAMLIVLVLVSLYALFLFRQHFSGKVRSGMDVIGHGEQYVPFSG